MNMGTPGRIPSSMILALLAALQSAATWAVEAASLGKLIPPYDPSWTVTSGLWCNRCREQVMARCRIDSWVSYDNMVSAKELKCQCGGPLSRELSKIILLQ